MTRPFAKLCPVALLVIPLAACSSPPPYATNVLALPRAGQSADQYQADDLACRTYMKAQAAANHWPVGANNDGAIASGARSPSDTAYAQCMTSRGYRVAYVNIFAPAPGYGNSYGYVPPGNAAVYPGGYSYNVTYPYAVGNVPFFFFVTHHHDGHHGDFHSRGFPT